MSRLYDALRRGHVPPGASAPARRTAQTDSVLATLGYVERPRAARRLLTIVCLVGAAVAGYEAWGWMSGPASPAHRSPVQAVRRSPRAASKSATARSNASSTAAVPPGPTVHARVDESVGRDVQPPLTIAPAPPRIPPRAIAALRLRQAAPDHPQPNEFELALYYQRAGDLERAKQHYLALLGRDVLNVEAHNNLGLLYKDEGQLDDAIREFRLALSANPRYGRALNNLGVTLLAKEQPDAAATQFEAVLAVDAHDVDALVNLALARKAAGDAGAAQRLLMRALTLDPHSAAAHYNLAVEYEMAGDAPRAVEHYRAFLQYAGADYAGRAADVRLHVETLDRHVS